MGNGLCFGSSSYIFRPEDFLVSPLTPPPPSPRTTQLAPTGCGVRAHVLCRITLLVTDVWLASCKHCVCSGCAQQPCFQGLPDLSIGLCTWLSRHSNLGHNWHHKPPVDGPPPCHTFGPPGLWPLMSLVSLALWHVYLAFPHCGVKMA